MSLTAVHIFFIFVSILVSAGFGYWAIQDYRVAGNGMNLFLGILSSVATFFLVFYLRWFIRKGIKK